MSMESFSQKLLTKSKTFLVFCCLALLVIACLGNIFLAIFKNSITRSINRRFFRTISIERVFYVPPNYFILKNMAISEEDAAKDKKIVFIPSLRIGFSLPHLIMNQQASISYLHLSRPTMNYHDLFSFLKNNMAQILEFLRSMPKQETRLFIRKAKLEMFEKNKPADIELTFTGQIKENSISGGGVMKKNIYDYFTLKENNLLQATTSLPLWFRVKGALTKNGIALDKLEFKREDLYCQLWGESDGTFFELKGVLVMNTNFNQSSYQTSSSEAASESNISLQRLMTDDFSELINAPEANLHILNIDSSFKFLYPRLQIERLNCSINNNPIQLKGDFFLSRPFYCDFKLHSNFRSLDKNMPGILKDITVTTSAKMQGSQLNVNGSLNIDFIEKQKDRLPLEKVELGVKGLSIALGDTPLLKMELGQLDFFCRTNANAYRIILDDLDLEFSKLNDKFKNFKFSSRFYDGLAEGNGRIEIREFTPIITAFINIKDADANKLDGILIHFSKMHGRLKSEMSFLNYPELVLRGNMIINDGYLQDFEFFKWLADSFTLPSLKKIFFSKTGSDFVVDEKGGSLLDMYLESQDVKLNGYFKLGERDLVSSKINLTFSKPLLKTSPKFTSLLKLLHESVDFLNFDFQMSGNLSRMNFQWLQSDFKREIMKAIPGFIERKIERDIEKFVQSIPKK